MLDEQPDALSNLLWLIYLHLYISFLIQHKCGYCGWVFKFTTKFTEHECFKDYVEEIDRINIDENYVVTIGITIHIFSLTHFTLLNKLNNYLTVKNNPTVDKKENLNELLIEAVRSKPGLYDLRVPAL